MVRCLLRYWSLACSLKVLHWNEYNEWTTKNAMSGQWNWFLSFLKLNCIFLIKVYFHKRLIQCTPNAHMLNSVSVQQTSLFILDKTACRKNDNFNNNKSKMKLKICGHLLLEVRTLLYLLYVLHTVCTTHCVIYTFSTMHPDAERAYIRVLPIFYER